MLIDVAIEKVQGLIVFFQNYRETGFLEAPETAKGIALEMDIGTSFRKRREIKRKRHFDENPDVPDVATLSPEESFRISYFIPIVDQAISSLTRRFEQYQGYQKMFGFLFTSEILQSLDNESLKSSCDNLEAALEKDGKYDIDANELYAELKFLQNFIPQENMGPLEILKFLKRHNSFPNAIAHASGPCAGRARGHAPKARWAELEATPRADTTRARHGGASGQARRGKRARASEDTAGRGRARGRAAEPGHGAVEPGEAAELAGGGAARRRAAGGRAERGSPGGGRARGGAGRWGGQGARPSGRGSPSRGRARRGRVAGAERARPGSPGAGTSRAQEGAGRLAGGAAERGGGLVAGGGAEGRGQAGTAGDGEGAARGGGAGPGEGGRGAGRGRGLVGRGAGDGEVGRGVAGPGGVGGANGRGGRGRSRPGAGEERAAGAGPSSPGRPSRGPSRAAWVRGGCRREEREEGEGGEEGGGGGRSLTGGRRGATAAARTSRGGRRRRLG
uniref:Uncharacterized protein n=1 Tax=Zea mays TaxID=4577 RepID=A0A804N6N7_MAIZE